VVLLSHRRCRPSHSDACAPVLAHGVVGTFPIKNAVQRLMAATSKIAFVAEIDAQGLSLVYSTYLGGSEPMLRRDRSGLSGNAYVTGETNSAIFLTVNALHPASRQWWIQAFVSVISGAQVLRPYSVRSIPA